MADPGVFDVAGLLSNQTVKAILIWQVAGQVMESMLAPELGRIQQELYKRDPTLQLTIADAVSAVIRGHISEAEGADNAADSGLSMERFRILLANAGQPPGLEFLAEAWRRGFIPQAGTGAEAVSLEQGIRESDLKNKWIPTVEAMQFHLAPVGTLIEGWLRAQVTEADALRLLAENGIDEPTARLMYKSAGRPPGPMELIELHRRGIIPEAGEGGDTLSLRQGYLETDLKNKWYQAWLDLARYVPPPRTVTALLRAGSLTDAEALALFKDAGLNDHLAAVYVANAHHERAHAAREATKAELLALYQEQALTRAELLKDLEGLGYAGPVAEMEAELIDFKRVKGLIDHAVNRLRTLYTGHKIDKTATHSALGELGLPAAQVDHLLSVWEMERRDNVKTLTPAQIVRAAKLGIISNPTAFALLQREGYPPFEAYVVLSDGLGGTPSDVPAPL